MIPRLMYSAPEQRPERRAADHYPTPAWLIEEALALVEIEPKRILDPGAGCGRWGAAARARWPDAFLAGWDIRPLPSPRHYDFWWSDDVLLDSFDRPFDLIMGNPPYCQAEEFVRFGLRSSSFSGELIFLLRLPFLAGQKRRDGLFREWAPYQVAVCSKRPSFSPDGRTNSEDFCLIHWRKDWRGETRLRWLGSFS